MKKCLLPLLMCLPLFAQPNAWQVSTENGSILLSYQGKTLLTGLSVGGFTPGWKRQRFTLGTPAMVRNGNSHVFSKSNDEADATLTITCEGKQAVINLNLTAKPSGPFEFGLFIPVKNFATKDGMLFPRMGKAFFPIEDDITFVDHGGRELSFELPEIRYQLNNKGDGNFILQDRRKGNEGSVRYIAVLHADEEKTYRCQLVWTVEDNFDAETLALRQATYKRPLVRNVKVDFANPGFEDGMAEWNQAPNFFIDETVAHSGGKSGKIVVVDPMKENVYITRQIPVIGGANYTAECFVKTLDIKATPGKMSTVGAGLIVEWADKDKKWIAAGVYSCNHFGTKNWTRCVAENLRAPDNAGYANIYLALRGSGTAWYDDLKITQIERSVDKLSPALGAVVNTNVPIFNWLQLTGAAQYSVQLSQDATFPQGKTRIYDLDIQSSFQLPEPLEAGVWYWKVNAPGSPDIQPWRFTQTVPADKDCLPPTIITQAKRVLTPDTPVLLKVQEGSAQRPVITAVLQDMTVVKVTDAGKKDCYEYQMSPEGGWKHGLNTVTATAMDAAGNKSTKEVWVLCAPVPQNPVVIDVDGCYSQNGQRIFPFGIYEVHKEDMMEIRQAGFDAVHTYQWESSHDDVACRKYLDDCWAANGLRAFIGFDRGSHTGAGIVQGNFAHVAHRVGALADHPGLFCWYLFDEPEIPAQYVPPKLLTDFANLIRELDPYHAVVMTTWGPGMNRYRQTWDTHWTQSYTRPDGIVQQIAEHRKFLLNNSPITLLVHCYDQKQTTAMRAGVKATPEAFEPDEDWMRAAAFVGVVKNANGLWWWWWARQQSQYYTVGHVPHAWEGLKRVVSELKTLRPVLNSKAIPQFGTVEAGKAKVEWWMKNVEGKITFIAVNTSESELTADIDIPNFGRKSFTFKRYEVKVLNY